ncbi:MAG: CHAT domain-containing protein [Bacteroidota bacterium]|nr:CHAT domain-containing protein [Bacteroidota bacterium]
MIYLYRILRLLIVCSMLSCWNYSDTQASNVIPYNSDDSDMEFETDHRSQSDDPSRDLEKLNAKILAAVAEGDTMNSRIIVKSMLKILKSNNIDNLTSSASQFYIGVYYLVLRENSEAINWFRLSASIRRQISEDEILAKCLYNMGIAYNNLGDYRKMEQYTLESLEVEKKLYGESSPLLLSGYSSLVSAYFGQNEYNKAIATGNTALKLINGSKGSYGADIANLYTSIGACYVRMSDYSKAVLYLEKAESVYKVFSLGVDDNYINLLNTLAVTYFFLGNNKKSDDYFNRGVSLIKSSNSSLSFNLINSFAIVLGNAGKIRKGEILIINSLNKARDFSGPDSREYFEVMKNYAEYLRTFNIDINKSLRLYEQCLSYLNNHSEDVSLKDQVLLGYALTLSGNGEAEKALEVVQGLLFHGINGKGKLPALGNPDPDQMEADQWTINVLKAKYRILWDLYSKSKYYNFLETASNTSELLVRLIEKVRINISEEDSRVILGDRYRDAYLYAIRDFDLCYKQTGNKAYRDKAFEYSEKSKVAGLLASTRELKATQFHIPPEIADLERRLKMEIGFYNAMISEENAGKKTDASVVSEWKNVVLSATQKRDSLINVLEKNYPEYYQIKYNTSVLGPHDIPRITGRNTNYLNYVVADTCIYIFLTNRKHQELLTISIDSGFFETIRRFRNLLSNPLTSARTSFTQFQETGRILYRTIFEPVRKYLISDKLLISPDNILSYIPFEAIPAGNAPAGKTQFRDIPYLMDDYRISYTYSATLLAESTKKSNNFSNSVIAFAPVYTGTIDVDSLLILRQVRLSKLRDLPYARIEAEFVTSLTNGKLCINNGAKESVFKSEAGKYDVIHLAMHTVLNDQYPMYSKMLFYQEKDSVEDGNLNTYEVYGIPLKAKMVILSSCNTGSGKLHSGEGILSLARGFIYAGSQSVIMSMWEIDDRSGTEIVKDFYRNLKKGETKSTALRKARIDYLKNADMLRSHPYFWSSLVIYGNNSQLYPSKQIFLLIGAVIILVSGIVALISSHSRNSLYSGSSFIKAIRASLLRYFLRRA